MTDKETILDVYILLDRSGSMSYNWIESIGSINGYVEGLKKANANAFINVAAFDDAEPYLVVRDAVHVNNWVDLTTEEIKPRGSTPLYDAVGKAFQQAEAADNDKVVFIIQTDGQENASKEFTQPIIKAKMAEVTKRGWEVIFLGANFDASHYTQSFGLQGTKFVNTSNATRGMAMSDLASKTMGYAAAGNLQEAAVAMSFTPEEQAKFDKK